MPVLIKKTKTGVMWSCTMKCVLEADSHSAILQRSIDGIMQTLAVICWLLFFYLLKIHTLVSKSFWWFRALVSIDKLEIWAHDTLNTTLVWLVERVEHDSQCSLSGARARHYVLWL